MASHSFPRQQLDIAFIQMYRVPLVVGAFLDQSKFSCFSGSGRGRYFSKGDGAICDGREVLGVVSMFVFIQTTWQW